MTISNISSEKQNNTDYIHEYSDEQKNKLLMRMKTTKSNRFNCAKRLEMKAKVKSLTTNVLSILTILVGVYILAFANNLTPNLAQFIGVFSIGVSLVSIFISFETSVQELSKRAADAHRCGREVSEIYRSFQARQLPAIEASRRYETIISRYDDNHDRCDYLSTLRNYRSEMPDEAKNKSVNWLNSHGASYVSMGLPAVMGVLGVILVIGICYFIPIIGTYI